MAPSIRSDSYHPFSAAMSELALRAEDVGNVPFDILHSLARNDGRSLEELRLERNLDPERFAKAIGLTERAGFITLTGDDNRRVANLTKLGRLILEVEA